jgi:hypothetical protein
MYPGVRPIIVTLHGIRTRGEWQKRIAPRIARFGMIPILLDYGYFNLFQFLNPLARSRRVHWLRDEIATVRRDYPRAPISIVAHSLGTYLVARMIEETPAFHFETLLFSGSIVRADYDWSAVLESNRVNYVANYIAGKDIWPLLASLCVAGAGNTGNNGFSTTHGALFQHTHRKYGHSDYFRPFNFEALWLPKLAVSQRDMIDNLSTLLAAAALPLHDIAAVCRCLLRARLFYRAHGDTCLRQFPGIHLASGLDARYAEDELDYIVVDRPVFPAGPLQTFQAGFVNQPFEWIAGTQPPLRGRGDVLAALAAPVKLPVHGDDDIIGMLSLEILTQDANTYTSQAQVLRQLLPQLSQQVGRACLMMQKLFPKEWT